MKVFFCFCLIEYKYFVNICSLCLSFSTGHAEVPAVSSKKVYTVLPPPEDYVSASGDRWGSSTIAQPVNNADEMPGKKPFSV